MKYLVNFQGGNAMKTYKDIVKMTKDEIVKTFGKAYAEIEFDENSTETDVVEWLLDVAERIEDEYIFDNLEKFGLDNHPYVQEAYEEYHSGWKDRYYEGYDYGLYSVENDYFEEGNGAWYSIGYSSFDAYDCGLADS